MNLVRVQERLIFYKHTTLEKIERSHTKFVIFLLQISRKVLIQFFFVDTRLELCEKFCCATVLLKKEPGNNEARVKIEKKIMYTYC